MMRWYQNNFAPLVGRVLTGHRISADRQTLTLKFTGGEAKLVVYGDCCSGSWIESVDMPDNLKGKILAVEDIDMPDLGSVPTEHQECVDVVSYYGLKIVTENGHCVIDYRNNSNGYYGGEILLDSITQDGANHEDGPQNP